MKIAKQFLIIELVLLVVGFISLFLIDLKLGYILIGACFGVCIIEMIMFYKLKEAFEKNEQRG